jgi:hypothetical protein
MIPTTCARLGEDRILWLQTLPYLQCQSSVAIVHASPNGHRLDPELSGVVDMQDFDGLVFDAVCRNIGQAGKDQLERSLFTSQSSPVGRRLQGTNGLVKLKDSGLRKM